MAAGSSVAGPSKRKPSKNAHGKTAPRHPSKLRKLTEKQQLAALEKAVEAFVRRPPSFPLPALIPPPP